ncbi:hypothetical protein FPV67DRAFT_1507922 [Lyophyllum atratum]|nr:hypothetical protein FPV67DRAFT_1507922 [Lyophyllum atratum]
MQIKKTLKDSSRMFGGFTARTLNVMDTLTAVHRMINNVLSNQLLCRDLGYRTRRGPPQRRPSVFHIPSFTTMTGVDITIDDESPLIRYQPLGAWSSHNSSTDEVANNFYGKTYTQTQQPGATMFFAFEGTAVAVYGSKNVNHGNYTVDIDGNNRRQSGKSSVATQSVEYQAPIFVSSILSPGPHTLTLLSLENAAFDIDYITWTSSVNRDKGGPLVRLVIDDVDPAFQFQTNEWATPPNLSNFSNNTGHAASQLGAFINFTFTDMILTSFLCEGDAVSLFGSVGPNNSPYTVQLDDQPANLYVATQSTYAPRTLLFYASDLGAGEHTLHVLNQGNALLEIDYAEVYMLPIFVNGTSASGQTQFPGGTKRSSLSPGTIAGISVGAAMSLILIYLVFIGLRKRHGIRRRDLSAIRHRYVDEEPVPEDATVVSPFRLFRSSSSTFGSPKPPIAESKKPHISDINTIVPSPSLHWQSHVPMSPATAVEDGPNTAASQRTRRKSRPKEMTGIGPRTTPISIPQQTHAHRSAISAGHLMTPIDSIPEVRESMTSYSSHRSPVASRSGGRLNHIQESEDGFDATSDAFSVHSSPPVYPGAPAST